MTNKYLEKIAGKHSIGKGLHSAIRATVGSKSDSERVKAVYDTAKSAKGMYDNASNAYEKYDHLKKHLEKKRKNKNNQKMKQKKVPRFQES
jgi:hypothetical protein